MQIYGATRKMTKTISSQRELKRVYGPKLAVKIEQRISELKAALVLSDISHLPPARLHMLIGDWSGYFAVDLTSNFRLIFQGLDTDDEESIDKDAIVGIVIKEVEDYHGN